jgi:hypothetical protein
MGGENSYSRTLSLVRLSLINVLGICKILNRVILLINSKTYMSRVLLVSSQVLSAV